MWNRIVLIALFSISLITSLKAQDSILEYFNASRVSNKIFLSWKITSGNTCNGIEIQHSLDSSNYTTVGYIEGICGSQSTGISYDFTHSSPTFNQKNYYRLLLGNSQNSKVISIEIFQLEENNYLIRPNPILTTGELYFKNTNKQNLQINIYNTAGQLLQQATTSLDFYIIDTQLLGNGHYIFTIINELEGNPIKGSFLIDKH
jgi:hypothetical protein